MQTLMDLLCSWVSLLPFDCLQLRFMQEAFLCILLCAPLAAAAGTQVVNFRMSFFSDAIGHSAFAGVAIGLIIGVSPDWTLPVLALGIGLGIMALKKCSSLSSDTVIGVFFSCVVAFGLALASRIPSMVKDTQVFLYGDILTVSNREILTLFVLSVVFYGFEIFSYNRLIAIGIHEQLARTHRIRVTWYQYIHVGLLTLVVVFCVKAVGVLLVTALLIVPAAAARNLSRSSGGMFWFSVLTGLISGVAGLLISAQDWAGTAAGATIVLCACLIFVISLGTGLFKRKRKI
ncbi:MAG: metal ABC transporter permease [Lentisphaeria bacterium]|nr:metal ABC transporter permease [Lentisphaeria bacterium]